ncbi:hypothetical protein NMS84_001356 [Vibrio cholerae]|nr:hypothetical protein [Vibrio cholerae]
MKVEKQHIENLVSQLEFKFARVENTTVTGCWAFLPNGFQVAYGESACVDPANYKWEDDCKCAKERCLQQAENKLWELEGYLLKVTGQTSDQFERASEAFAELKESKSFPPAGFSLYKLKKDGQTVAAYQIKGDDTLVRHHKYGFGADVLEIEISGKNYQFACDGDISVGDFIITYSVNRITGTLDFGHVRRSVFEQLYYI